MALKGDAAEISGNFFLRFRLLAELFFKSFDLLMLVDDVPQAKENGVD
jgi:hypothetical protein